MAKAAIEKATQAAAQETVTEQPKEKDRYKLTYGNFESRKKALEELTTVKKKGYNAALIIEGLCYKIFFGEFDKTTGDTVLAALKEAGFIGELS
jgi:Sporulation related domain.